MSRHWSSDHITWLACHVIYHTVTSDLAAHATWHTVTSDLASAQPGIWSTSPGTGPHLCPVQAAEPIPQHGVRDTYLKRFARRCNSHAAGVTCTPTQHLHLRNLKTSYKKIPIAHQRRVIKYTTYVLFLCIIEFFISSLGTYRPKYHYEFVTTPSVNIIK